MAIEPGFIWLLSSNFRQNSSAFIFVTLFLQDDVAERPRMASAISSLANYSAALPAGPSDPDSKPVEKANLGTLMGVYLPCIQNIFGVILFIRMTWIVGTAGAIQGFFVVFLACTVVSSNPESGFFKKFRKKISTLAMHIEIQIS